MMRRVGNLKVWAALLVGGVSAALAVAIGVASFAGISQAATPTRATIEQTQFTVAPHTRGEAFAVCPGTKRVVGGGVVQSGSANLLSVLASGPLDATGFTLNTDDGDVAKQWYAAVGNNSGAERTFRVFALCSGASDATIEATQFKVAPGSLTVPTTGEAFAVCPGTKRALGGGVVQSGSTSFNLSVRASGPLDATGVTLNTDDGDVAKQWYAAVSNFGTTERTLRVFALCSDASDATIEQTQFTVAAAEQNQFGDSTIGQQFAVCPGTKRAVGGGVVQSGSAGSLDLRASGPLDATGVTLNTNDGDKAKRWYAAVSNFGTTVGATRTLRVFALCSGASDATIEQTQFTVAPDTTGEAFAVCPGTKRVVGGGVVQSGSARRLWVRASGPLDATGVTLNTDDGDVAKQWYAAVLNGDDTERTLRVFALCSDASDATIEQTQFTVAAAGGEEEQFAVCPGTKRAVGGGVVQSGSAAGLFVRASGPLDATGVTLNTDDGDVAKQWYAAVTNNGTPDGPPERTLRVFALCSDASDATIEQTQFTTDSTEAFAVCPGTKRAVGGGVVQSGSANRLPDVRASGPLDATGFTLNTDDGDKAKQWYVAVSNFGTTDRTFRVFGICE